MLNLEQQEVGDVLVALVIEDNPQELDVMVDKTIDRVEKSRIFTTRGCPIRHFARMDFKEEDSHIEEQILPLYVAHLGNDFDQFQEVYKLIYYFHVILQV